MFIDTENTFRPNRLRTIADRFNLDHEAMLGNVVFCRAYTSEQQFELLDHVSAKFHEEAGVFKLLVSFESVLIRLKLVLEKCGHVLSHIMKSKIRKIVVVNCSKDAHDL